jgi:methionine sulfoxide reductase heme-binding subunit
MSPTAWYMARSAGTVAYLLLSGSVVLGVLLSLRARLAWPRFAVEDLHRFLTILTGIFVALHGLSLLLDRVVTTSLLDELVPFRTSYRPFAVGLGVTAAELMAAVGITNLFRSALPYRLWRQAHYLTIAVWILASAHVLLAGSDRAEPWFAAIVASTIACVVVALVVRLLASPRAA